MSWPHGMPSESDGPQSRGHPAVGRGRDDPVSQGAPGSAGSRRNVMTPVEKKEASMQVLMTAHKDRLRKLALERQQIMHSQALYLGKVEPVRLDDTNPQARAAQRLDLVQQLADSQAAAETMLESLKQGSTLDEARKASQAVHAEMTAIRANAAAEHPLLHSYAVPGTSGMNSTRTLLNTPSVVSPTPGPTSNRMPSPGHAPVATQAGYLGGMRTTAAPHHHHPAAAHNHQAAGGGSLLWHHDMPGQQARRARIEAALHEEAILAQQDEEEMARRSRGRSGGMARPRVRTAEEESPAYIQELKSQVEALRDLVEVQVQRSSAPQAPMMMPVPWYPQPPQQQQQQQQPQDGLPADVLAMDPSMRGVQARHQRDMALLRMEIDKARTAAELEQIKGALADLKRRGGTNEPEVGPPAPPPPATAGPQSVYMMDVPPGEPLDSILDDDDDDSDFTDDDDSLTDKTFNLGAGSVVRADVLNVHVMTAGPCTVRGSYRIRIVLYDGFQPLYVGPGLVVGCSTSRRALTSVNSQQVANFNETVTLRGLSLTPTMMLVFEVYVAKQALAGMPSREDLCAWSYCNALTHGELVNGRQSLPLYRLPIMMSAQRHFSYNGAMLDFSVSHTEGEQGDGVPAGTAAGKAKPTGTGKPGANEDVAGVPNTAWLRVARGTPPADPFTPGEGLVVVVDAARFLPANVTITKVVGTVFSPDRRALTPPFEALSQPDSDAFNPRYGNQFTLALGLDKFDNAAATLLLTVYTMERWSGSFRVVGYAAVPCFLDPRTKEQPVSKNVQDYVLNMGAFQVPLHIALPPETHSFRAKSLEGNVCRVPCASLLVRLMTPDMAKAKRRTPAPLYADRVYDSMRAQPTPVERQLFAKYQARKPLLVREAARLLVGSKAGAGGAQEAGSLPSTDEELLDWIEVRLRPSPSEPAAATTPIFYNLSSEYYQDLGFYVAVDAAMRLPRNLPSGALVTFAPPGSFYQDNPVLDDMKVTLQYDMNSCLAAPRWLDGYQHFADVVYEPGLALLIDIRLLVPSAGSTSPAGWTVLPVFERHGPFVATGTYHLPLFQGVPSRNIIQEFANKGDVDSVVIQQLKAKRLKIHEDCSSVLVRLIDTSRQGQLLTALTPEAGPAFLQRLRMPAYVTELGPKFLGSMRKDVRNKTYSQAKPENMSEDVWVESLNNCICKIAGLEVTRQEDDDDDDDEDIVA